jgi:hypothetical protein
MACKVDGLHPTWLNKWRMEFHQSKVMVFHPEGDLVRAGEDRRNAWTPGGTTDQVSS